MLWILGKRADKSKPKELAGILLKKGTSALHLGSKVFKIIICTKNIKRGLAEAPL